MLRRPALRLRHQRRRSTTVGADLRRNHNPRHGANDDNAAESTGNVHGPARHRTDRRARRHTRRRADRHPRRHRSRRWRVDEQGSLLFRNLDPGDGYTISSATAISDTVSVADPAVNPPADFYSSQPKLPEGGFGYITTRDGTTLSANVVLPGPADQGPYPTVVEYSGYQPSDPGSAQLAQIYTAMGFAYVGVNMRGTGCSGGSYRFFETVQNLDGYDAIETVAAQPWVLDNQVGMVGISYPGITQLVRRRHPAAEPQLDHAAVGDRRQLPGNAVSRRHPQHRLRRRRGPSRSMDKSKPFGQAWTKERADAGDTICADNQKLRLQNPDLVKEIDDNPYYSPTLGDSLAPITFVDKIKVPVFHRRRVAGRADRRPLPGDARQVHRLAARLRDADERPAHRVAEPARARSLLRVPRSCTWRRRCPI